MSKKTSDKLVERFEMPSGGTWTKPTWDAIIENEKRRTEWNDTPQADRGELRRPFSLIMVTINGWVKARAIIARSQVQGFDLETGSTVMGGRSAVSLNGIRMDGKIFSKAQEKSFKQYSKMRESYTARREKGRG